MPPLSIPVRSLAGYRVHTLLCRGSGLPLFFLLSQALVHDAPFARPLLAWAVRLYGIRPRIIRLDAAYPRVAQRAKLKQKVCTRLPFTQHQNGGRDKRQRSTYTHGVCNEINSGKK